VNVVEEALDVHTGPGKTANTRAKAALKVVNVGSKETAGVGSDFVNNTDALSHDILELIVIVLELFFLK